MPDYSIYILDEQDLTIVGGVLDGVNQGTGTHLVGATITLNTDAWTEIQVTDNDPNFQDSDTSQVLNGAQEIDGVLYASGTAVEAEYSLVVTDGTNTYTVIGFNVTNSSPVYGTVEGLAFIGPVGGFPPVGVELTVVSNAEGPVFDSTEYATPVCFGPGTLIDTVAGPRPIETLVPGDLVWTAEAGLRPLLAVHAESHAAFGAAAPVVFRAGAVGNTRDLVLSPNHRIRLAGWRAEMLFGLPEVLVPAKMFVEGSRAVARPGGAIPYYHLVFDQHHLVRAEGILAETLLVSPATAARLGQSPDIVTGQTARPVLPVLKSYEARLLLAA